LFDKTKPFGQGVAYLKSCPLHSELSQTLHEHHEHGGASMNVEVDAVKYAPLEKRGMGISSASSYMAYGSEASKFIEFSNEQTMVIPQFEDPALVDPFEGMISQPHVDAVVIGPRDLSLNMGFPDGPDHPEVQEMIDRVIAICRKANVSAGITAGTRADSAKQVARGATMILAASQALVMNGSKEFLP